MLRQANMFDFNYRYSFQNNILHKGKNLIGINLGDFDNYRQACQKATVVAQKRNLINSFESRLHLIHALFPYFDQICVKYPCFVFMFFGLEKGELKVDVCRSVDSKQLLFPVRLM